MTRTEQLETIICKVVAMRDAQKNYFSLKKASGTRWQTKETKVALELSKKLESDVDQDILSLVNIEEKKCKCGNEVIAGFDNCMDCAVKN